MSSTVELVLVDAARSRSPRARAHRQHRRDGRARQALPDQGSAGTRAGRADHVDRRRSLPGPSGSGAVADRSGGRLHLPAPPQQPGLRLPVPPGVRGAASERRSHAVLERQHGRALQRRHRPAQLHDRRQPAAALQRRNDDPSIIDRCRSSSTTGESAAGCEPTPEKDQPAGPATIKPGVWISIVGDGQIIPLRVYCNKDQKSYVFAPKLRKSAAGESMHDVSATGPTMVLIAIALFAGTAAIVFASWCRKIGRPETVGAIGLGLCGALIPLAALAVIIPAEAWQLWHPTNRGNGGRRSTAMAVAAWCWWIVVYAVAFQFRSRALAGPRAVFAVAAGLVAWYVTVQIASLAAIVPAADTGRGNEDVSASSPDGVRRRPAGARGR